MPKKPQDTTNLLERNRAWVAKTLMNNDQYFAELAIDQKPDYLWIGCADSRVPSNIITNAHPGELFVHRNIANLVVHTDMNMLSVLHYAVNVLKVKHVIVCGHYGCGGIKAAMSDTHYGFIDNWLTHIKDVYRLHVNEIDSHDTHEERENELIRWNIIEQVNNLSKTSIIQQAWDNKQSLDLHGWVYSLEDGLLHDLGVTLNAESGATHDIYQFKF